jgi:membrane-bound serine protease (ClpP class)
MISFVSAFLLIALAAHGAEAEPEGSSNPDPITAIRTATTGIARGSFNPAKRGLNLPPTPKVMIIPVNDKESTKYGMIDDWQAGFIKRRLDRAEAEKFDLVILEINTHGGSVDACDNINAAIASCKVPVIAYVNDLAFSGGALISLGTKAIIMAPNSRIGGAKVVTLFGDLPEGQRQKANSDIRAAVTNLCQANNYPLPIAVGMVNSDVEVLEISDPKMRFVTNEDYDLMTVKPAIVHKWKSKDSILTLATSEAINAGLASGVAADHDDIFLGLGVVPSSIEIAGTTASESTARFVSNPLWSILLVIVGLVALVWEMKSPGHGMGYVGFAFCMGVFLWLQVFSHNAGIIEILLFGAGAAIVAVELFFMATFGAGLVVGFGMILMAVVLAFIPESVNLWKILNGTASTGEMNLLTEGLKWATITLVSIVVAAIVGLLQGAKLPGMSRLALRTEVTANIHSTGVGALELPVAGTDPALVGQQATTETVLRPGGKVRLSGITYDAVSEGGFIEPGTQVVVLRVNSGSLVVRAV